MGGRESPKVRGGPLTGGMNADEALSWLRAVRGQLYRNRNLPSGRSAWVAVVRTPGSDGRNGKVIIALGGSMEEAASAAEGQWQAIWGGLSRTH